MAPLVPLGVMTATLTSPAAWAGTVAVIVESSTTATPDAAVPPKVTLVAPVRFVPVIVIEPPPEGRPIGELSADTAGASA